MIAPPPLPRMAPAPRPSRMKWVVALVAVLFVFWVVRGIGRALHHTTGMAKTGAHGAHWLQETVLADHDSSDKIAVLDVNGVISSSAIDRSGHSLVDLIKDQLELAKEDSAVKAVILRVDSPGGEVPASDDIYRIIKNFQTDSKKPVITSMGSLAASGGYYVSAPTRWIVANELTLTGSIGVIMHSYNYRGLMDKIGVRPDVFKSGKFKDMLSGEKLISPPEEQAMVQSLVDETFARFKEIVAEGRGWAGSQNKSEGRKLTAKWADYADGRVVSGKQAYDLGFVDELGNFETAVRRAEEIAGINKANLVQYAQPFDIGSLFRLFGEAKTGSLIKIDLGVEMPKLQAGRLYFMCPTVVR